jgi:CheY-like chemotaxis protein
VKVSEEIGEAQLMAHIESAGQSAEPALAPPPELDAARPTGEGAPAADGAPRPTRFGYVLVVDDNEVNRSMLSRRLVKEGYRVATAADGKQALQRAREESFDLILLDIVMPEMNGYQVLDALKSDPALRDTPVIMISALDELSSIVRCIEVGAEDYLPKPFDPVLLRARIGASLEKKRLRNEELRYLRQVAVLTDAALALEQKAFSPHTLETVAAREDALGRLARTFQRMGAEVQAREQRLEQQVQQLRIEIDETRKLKDVSEITESDYFQQLRSKVHTLRARSGGQSSDGPG